MYWVEQRLKHLESACAVSKSWGEVKQRLLQVEEIKFENLSISSMQVIASRNKFARPFMKHGGDRSFYQKY